jgi:ABC-type amino acid transport substrate-binding protein
MRPHPIRVGYTDSPGFIEKTADGTIDGYGVAYLNEISHYTGWRYEYVYATWQECLELLAKGEIDLLGMAQYTPERSEKYEFASLPSGVEYMVMYVRNDDNGIYYNDYQSFNGLKIGVLKGNFQTEVLSEVARKNSFTYQPVLFDSSQSMIAALQNKQIDAVAASLEGLTADEAMQKKYGVSGVAPLLFAVGDGNHSLATAKACYEEQKKGKTPEEYLALPARYALVEVVNNHDDALQFEPIHRVLFGVDQKKFMDAFRAAYPNAYEGKGDGHTIEFVWNGESHFITVPDPKVQLAVGTLQGVIDQYLKDNGGEVDYIHGDDVTRELGGKPGNMGFLLPAMGKEQLFKTVMADGVLPRKTFSMGHAQDKRYYIEARKIVK